MKIKALYTVSELADMLDMSRDSVRRLVRRAGIAVEWGERRKALIPLSELKDRCPELWESLLAARKVNG